MRWRLPADGAGGGEEGVRRRSRPLETAYQTDLGRFGELLDKERLVGNLHRAFSEMRGEPLGAPLNPASSSCRRWCSTTGGRCRVAWRDRQSANGNGQSEGLGGQGSCGGSPASAPRSKGGRR